jgi:hypothetical protein
MTIMTDPDGNEFSVTNPISAVIRDPLRVDSGDPDGGGQHGVLESGTDRDNKRLDRTLTAALVILFVTGPLLRRSRWCRGRWWWES